MRDASDALGKALWPLLAVVGAIGVLAVLIYFVRSWLRDNDGPAASEHEMLASYREMNLRGELSDEEYRIIKGRMAPKLGPTVRSAEEVPPPPAEKLEKD